MSFKLGKIALAFSVFVALMTISFYTVPATAMGGCMGPARPPGPHGAGWNACEEECGLLPYGSPEWEECMLICQLPPPIAPAPAPPGNNMPGNWGGEYDPPPPGLPAPPSYCNGI